MNQWIFKGEIHWVNTAHKYSPPPPSLDLLPNKEYFFWATCKIFTGYVEQIIMWVQDRTHKTVWGGDFVVMILKFSFSMVNDLLISINNSLIMTTNSINRLLFGWNSRLYFTLCVGWSRSVDALLRLLSLLHNFDGRYILFLYSWQSPWFYPATLKKHFAFVFKI